VSTNQTTDVAALYAAYRADLRSALAALARVHAGQGGSHDDAMERVTRALQAILALSHLRGAALAWHETDAATSGRRAHFGKMPTHSIFDPVAHPLPRVPFQEAIDALEAQEPRLAKSAEEVKRLYSKDRVFALTYSVDKKVTERVKQVVMRSLGEKSVGPVREVNLISALGDWTTWYADTVLRTNATNVYALGRMEEMKDERIRAVLPVLMFVSILDGDTRPNHRAAHGLVAGPDDPVWKRLRPPLGFNCRCRLDTLTIEEARQIGAVDAGGVPVKARVPYGAHPDPGFKGGDALAS